MRLPRYARGLKLVRLGMFLMLLHFLLNAYLVTLMIRATPSDADSLMAVMRYTLYANLGAVGVMLVGALLAVPDFLAAKMSLARIIAAIVGFGIALAVVAWSTKLLITVTNLASHPMEVEYSELKAAVDDLDSLRFLAIVRDLGYGLGIIAILRSIRQTAQTNEHFPLRDAADTVSNMTGAVVVFDILYQVLFGGSNGAGFMTFYMVIFGLIAGIGLVVFWVYLHLRIAKFLKAAAILVYEPHNLPMATVVRVAPEPAADAPVPPPRPSAPIPKPAASSQPSQPLIVVAAELRQVNAPRAETSPGAPPGDEPKLLR